MNLLFAIKSLDVVGGGAERVLVDVANGLVARGHRLSVMTFDTPGNASFYPLDPAIRRIDLAVGEPGRPTPRLRFARSMPAIRKRVGEVSPDLVVAFMHSTYVPLAAALAGTGTRLVASEHVGLTHFRDRPLQRLMRRAVDALTVARTVPSAAIRNEYPASLRGSVHVLPNPIDVDSFAAAAGVAPALPPRILAVGRFMDEKNHGELIAAFHRLAPRFPRWLLRIAGEGELRPELERQVAALGLEDRVELPGVVRDIASEYAAATIVAVPSLYESFGMVTAEALASGRPVIAFAGIAATEELVTDAVNGLLVPSGGDRVAALADGLERLMSDATLRQRLGAAGPGAVARYRLAAIVDQWEAFLVSLVSDRGWSAIGSAAGSSRISD